MARHTSALIPFSKMKESLAGILKVEGYVRDYAVVKTGVHKALKLDLIYGEKNKPAITGIQRVSRPSLRIYTRHDEAPRVYGGLGTAILSTPKGVMTGRQAWQQKVGGEVICIVW